MELLRRPEEYGELIRLTKQRAGRTETNCLVMGGRMEAYIGEGRLFSVSFPDGVAFFLDEGRYYQFYYLIAEGGTLPELKVDRPAVATETGIMGKQTDRQRRSEELLSSAGFRPCRTSLLMEADLRKLSYPFREECHRRTGSLMELGFELRYCTDDMVPQVRELWETRLDLADVPLDHLKEDGNARILCAVNREGVVAAVHRWEYRSGKCEGRHTVTRHGYEGKGLATCLLLSQFVDAADAGTDRVQTWIHEDNAASLHLHEKVGYQATGRIATQFVLY